jgi:hypothetical protein
VESTGSPRVTRVLRYGFHVQRTYLLISFDGPLEPTSAEKSANYQIIGLGGQETGHGQGAVDGREVVVGGTQRAGLRSACESARRLHLLSVRTRSQAASARALCWSDVRRIHRKPFAKFEYTMALTFSDYREHESPGDAELGGMRPLFLCTLTEAGQMRIKANADAARMQRIPAKCCKCRQTLGILRKCKSLLNANLRPSGS